MDHSLVMKVSNYEVSTTGDPSVTMGGFGFKRTFSPCLLILMRGFHLFGFR